MTDEVVNGRIEIAGDDASGRVSRRTGTILSMPALLAPTRVKSVRLHVAQDGQ